VFGLDSIPFLATSYSEAKKLNDVSRPYLEKTLAAQGLKLLYAVPWPPQGLYSIKPVASMSDLKGTRMRAYNPATSQIAQHVGAQPITVQLAELSQALATGTVENFLTSSASGVDSKLYEQTKYFYDVNAWLPRNAVVVNQKAFRSARQADAGGGDESSFHGGATRLARQRGARRRIHQAARREGDEDRPDERNAEAGAEGDRRAHDRGLVAHRGWRRRRDHRSLPQVSASTSHVPPSSHSFAAPRGGAPSLEAALRRGVTMMKTMALPVPTARAGASVPRRTLDRLYAAGGAIGAMFVALIAVLMIGQSVLREFGVPTGAVNDVVAWCCAAAAFFTMADAFKHGDFVRVTLLLEAVPAAARRALELLSLAIASAAVAYLACWACIFTYESFELDEPAQGLLPIPIWIPQMSFALGSLLLLVAVIDDLIIVARGGVPTFVRLVQERHAKGDFSHDL
jgi:TRAP-type C4-dicarboxylate transport system permease small subunit